MDYFAYIKFVCYILLCNGLVPSLLVGRRYAPIHDIPIKAGDGTVSNDDDKAGSSAIQGPDSWLNFQ